MCIFFGMPKYWQIIIIILSCGYSFINFYIYFVLSGVFVNVDAISIHFNPSTAKLFNLNFNLLEVVSREAIQNFKWVNIIQFCKIKFNDLEILQMMSLLTLPCMFISLILLC